LALLPQLFVKGFAFFAFVVEPFLQATDELQTLLLLQQVLRTLLD